MRRFLPGLSLFWAVLSIESANGFRPSHVSMSPTTVAMMAATGKKFSQAAYSDERRKSSTPRQHPRADSQLAEKHMQRVRTAGRVGTKRFVDPCKVFIGNLPFSASTDNVRTWVCKQMGLPSAILISHINVVTDWKTGQSKGYAFVDFTEAMYATVCIDKCNGVQMDGRAVTVSQGKRKPDDDQLFVKNNKSKSASTEEERVIQQALEEAEPILSPEETALLRRLDPDLVADEPVSTVDAQLLLEVTDDDDEGVDGFWEGDDEELDQIAVFDEDGHTQPMNREQRRDSARRQKRRKLPHKGFEQPSDGNNSP